MKYLLDTCVISELVKPAPYRKVVDWLNEVPSDALFLSVITKGCKENGIECRFFQTPDKNEFVVTYSAP